MPGIWYEPVSRRKFSSVSLGAMASALVWQSVVPAEEDGDAVWPVALLSDTHIPADSSETYRGFSPTENLRQIVPDILAAGPAATVITGDAARLTGEVGDYQALHDLLQPVIRNGPVVVGMGNHDNRANFLRVFPRDSIAGLQPVSGKLVTVLDHPVVRIAMLDSLLYVNKVAGLLGKAQRSWLEQQVPKWADRPLVLMVHHTLGDGDGDLLDADRFFRLITPHRHVKAVFYGHSHVFAIQRHEHIHLVNLPACGYNFSDTQPVGWMSARFRPDGVELTMHAIGGNRESDSNVYRLQWYV